MKKDFEAGSYLEKPEIFADLINGGLYGGKQTVKAKTLRRADGETKLTLMDKDGKKARIHRFRDIIYESGESTKYILFACEHQSEVHYAMPVRNLLYDALNYTNQVQRIGRTHRENSDLKTSAEFLSGLTKEDRLIPVCTLVFYYGEDPWNGSMELHDMMQWPESMEGLHHTVVNYRLNLIHAGNVDPKNFKTGLREVFELLPYARDSDALEAYVNAHKEQYSSLEEETSRMVFFFLGEKNMIKETDRFKNQKGEVDMCTAFRQIEERGVAKGIEKGVSNGITLAKKVLKLFGNGMDVMEIAGECGISVDEVRRIVED